MSLVFGPSYLDIPIQSASQVTVLTWDGFPADLASPVVLGSFNDITFEVAEGGRYLIKVRSGSVMKEYHATLTEESYDPSEIRQYVDAMVADLQEQIDAGGGGGGGGVPPSRTLTAGAGLQGGGDLSANRTFSLAAASVASLAKADTAVQPARSVATGTGLTGGGNLSADRTLALTAASIASLAKADTAVQPAALTSGLATKANTSHTHDAADTISGVFNAARLGTGTADGTKYLAGDLTWKTYAAGGGGGAVTSVNTKIGDVVLTATDVGAVSTPGSGTAGRLLQFDATGAQSTIVAQVNQATGTIPVRATGGHIQVPDNPSNVAYATNKKYVDAGLDLKAPLASPAFTGTVTGIDKSMVGLGSVDNTADTAKPVSLSQQAALDLKANLASPAFTGTVTGISKAMVGLGSVDNTADLDKPISSATATALNAKAPTASPTFTGTVSGVTKAHVGLGSVDNTADTAKPVSTAQQTALNLKAPLASPNFTGTVTGITKAMVGLTNVDNTADSAKPISSATQTALNAKVTNGGGIATAMKITQAAYDALGTPDANTLYVIVG